MLFWTQSSATQYTAKNDIGTLYAMIRREHLSFWGRVLILVPCLTVGALIPGVHVGGIRFPFGLLVGWMLWFVVEGLVDSYLSRARS